MSQQNSRKNSVSQTDAPNGGGNDQSFSDDEPPPLEQPQAQNPETDPGSQTYGDGTDVVQNSEDVEGNEYTDDQTGTSTKRSAGTIRSMEKRERVGSDLNAAGAASQKIRSLSKQMSAGAEGIGPTKSQGSRKRTNSTKQQGSKLMPKETNTNVNIATRSGTGEEDELSISINEEETNIYSGNPSETTQEDMYGIQKSLNGIQKSPQGSRLSNENQHSTKDVVQTSSSSQGTKGNAPSPREASKNVKSDTRNGTEEEEQDEMSITINEEETNIYSGNPSETMQEDMYGIQKSLNGIQQSPKGSRLSNGNQIPPKVVVQTSRGSQGVKGNAPSPRGSVQATKGLQQSPRGFVQVTKDPQQYPRGSIQATKGPLQSPRGTLQGTRAPPPSPRGIPETPAVDMQQSSQQRGSKGFGTNDVAGNTNVPLAQVRSVWQRSGDLQASRPCKTNNASPCNSSGNSIESCCCDSRRSRFKAPFNYDDPLSKRCPCGCCDEQVPPNICGIYFTRFRELDPEECPLMIEGSPTNEVFPSLTNLSNRRELNIPSTRLFRIDPKCPNPPPVPEYCFGGQGTNKWKKKYPCGGRNACCKETCNTY